MFDSVAPEPSSWETWEQLLHERDPDPVAVLRAASQFLRYFESVQGEAVKAARHRARTWEEIGEAMGVTRQAAWARFGDAEGREITSIALRRRFGS
jgi:hypothetical protein